MSPETGDGDQLLEPVNLLSRKATLITALLCASGIWPCFLQVVELHRQSLRQSSSGHAPAPLQMKAVSQQIACFFAQVSRNRTSKAATVPGRRLSDAVMQMSEHSASFRVRLAPLIGCWKSPWCGLGRT